MTYEELLMEADFSGIIVKELPLQSGDGRCLGNRIAIRNDLPMDKKADTLAEELEHHYTTVGNILDQTKVNNRKQERLARLRAYDRRIGLSGIIQGQRQHCKNSYELAACLGVSEDTLQDAIALYREKYGCYAHLDGYTIIFEPSLTVIESFMD